MSPNVDALMMQLRASEDGRMAALMELQRLRTQLGFSQEQDMDAKMEVEQMTDELNHAREAKRRSEMQVIKVQEELEVANTELRTVKRQVASMKRRLAQVKEQNKLDSQQVNQAAFAGMNMLTDQQGGAGVGQRGQMGQVGQVGGSSCSRGAWCPWLGPCRSSGRCRECKCASDLRA